MATLRNSANVRSSIGSITILRVSCNYVSFVCTEYDSWDSQFTMPPPSSPAKQPRLPGRFVSPMMEPT